MSTATSSWPASGSHVSPDPQQLGLRLAALCAAPALPTLVAAWLDDRTLDGIGVWVKPLKFQLAFALHWLTLAWLASLLAPRARPALATWLRVGGGATLVELVVILLQAARGRASHFNTSTALDALLYYGVMGAAVLVIMVATLAMAWLLWRHPADPRRGAPWLGAVLGLGLGATLTLLVTAPLAAGLIDGPGPWISGVKSNAAGLPVLHWSTTGGDLRVPHFVATHLMQALPALGWLLGRTVDRRHPATARQLLGLAAAGGILATGWTMARAAAGQPLLPM